ncbi:unnamed protein product, partial [Amoebophrya sp. A25]
LKKLTLLLLFVGSGCLHVVDGTSSRKSGSTSTCGDHAKNTRGLLRGQNNINNYTTGNNNYRGHDQLQLMNPAAQQGPPHHGPPLKITLVGALSGTSTILEMTVPRYSLESLKVADIRREWEKKNPNKSSFVFDLVLISPCCSCSHLSDVEDAAGRGDGAGAATGDDGAVATGDDGAVGGNGAGAASGDIRGSRSRGSTILEPTKKISELLPFAFVSTLDIKDEEASVPGRQDELVLQAYFKLRGPLERIFNELDVDGVPFSEKQMQLRTYFGVDQFVDRGWRPLMSFLRHDAGDSNINVVNKDQASLQSLVYFQKHRLLRMSEGTTTTRE